MSVTKVLNAFLIFYFFLFTACSIDNNQSRTNRTKPLSANATKAAGKVLKQVQKLENSADALLNATEKYDKVLDKAFNIENDPQFATLSQEQRDRLLRL